MKRCELFVVLTFAFLLSFSGCAKFPKGDIPEKGKIALWTNGEFPIPGENAVIVFNPIEMDTSLFAGLYFVTKSGKWINLDKDFSEKDSILFINLEIPEDVRYLGINLKGNSSNYYAGTMISEGFILYGKDGKPIMGSLTDKSKDTKLKTLSDSLFKEELRLYPEYLTGYTHHWSMSIRQDDTISFIHDGDSLKNHIGENKNILPVLAIRYSITNDIDSAFLYAEKSLSEGINPDILDRLFYDFKMITENNLSMVDMADTLAVKEADKNKERLSELVKKAVYQIPYGVSSETYFFRILYGLNKDKAILTDEDMEALDKAYAKDKKWGMYAGQYAERMGKDNDLVLKYIDGYLKYYGDFQKKYNSRMDRNSIFGYIARANILMKKNLHKQALNELLAINGREYNLVKASGSSLRATIIKAGIGANDSTTLFEHALIAYSEGNIEFIDSILTEYKSNLSMEELLKASSYHARCRLHLQLRQTMTVFIRVVERYWF
jgi:hypothetical protein